MRNIFTRENFKIVCINSMLSIWVLVFLPMLFESLRVACLVYCSLSQSVFLIFAIRGLFFMAAEIKKLKKRL